VDSMCDIKAMKATEIFGEWDETILWSCLQGVMGDILVCQAAAAAWLGDFCLLAGEVNSILLDDVKEHMKERGQQYLILVPKNDDWADMIENYFGDHAKKISRYAIKKEKGIFDKERLQIAVNTISNEYMLKKIEKKEYDACLCESWCKDLVSNFQTYEQYEKLGLGYVVMENDEIVAGASSYSVYQGGLEIEIDTRNDHRRKGLAYACGAKLILECLERGIYPSWDAHNLASVSLAEKLGYHLDYEYLTYEILLK